MRDPDLVVRAQRAATALESAWCRWRNVHGLDTDPPPAVSSYVGYSLDAPWGEGRIVFGICAEEAEQLAELLEHHDCVGPIHASVTARSVDGTGSAPPDSAAGQPGAAGLLHVPAPAPASVGQQPLSASAVGSRHGDQLAPRRRGGTREPDEVSPLTAPVAPATDDISTPIARAVSRAMEASLTGQRVPEGEAHPPAVPQRLSAAPASRPGAADVPGGPAQGAAGGAGPETTAMPWPQRPDGPGDRPAPEDAEAAGAPGVAAFRFRRPVAMTERIRATSVTSADQAGLDDTVQTPVPVRPLDDRDRVSSAARHADAATWSASEVPGQAAVTDPAI
jgi:hypothetical protein